MRVHTIVGLACIALLCTACGALYPSAPVTERVLLPDAPPQAYLRATRTLVAMGGTHIQSQPTLGLLSGQVSGAVSLSIMVTPHGTGSQVEVSGVVLPNKIVLGEFDEVQKYAAHLRRSSHGG